MKLLVRPQVAQLGEATAALDALVRTLLTDPDPDPDSKANSNSTASALGAMTRPENALVVVSPELSIDGKRPVALEARMQSLACVSLLLRHKKGDALVRLGAVVRLAACPNTMPYQGDISDTREVLIRLGVFSRPAFCVNVMVVCGEISLLREMARAIRHLSCVSSLLV